MNTNTLLDLGFHRTTGSNSYDRKMILCKKMVKISLQREERTKEWGISFDDGEIFVIENADEILDWIADYVDKEGDI